MRKSISIHTVHSAHICIVQAIPDSEWEGDLDEVEVIDQKAKEIVEKYYDYDKEVSHLPTVEIDPGFCCNALTEIGLRGRDLESVTAAANEIADWVENDHRYKLVEIF